MLLVLPIVLPLGTAVLALLVWRSRTAQRWISLLGTAGLLAACLALLARVWQAGIQAVQVGGWPAPFGITLVADHLSAALLAVAALVALAVNVYAVAAIDADRVRFGFYPLLNILLMGICGAFVTGDLFNLYVWFEVLLIASFALLALGNEPAQLDGAIKYVTINLISSSLLLSGVAVIYSLTGSLNLADLSQRLPAAGAPGLVTTAAMLFLVAFGIKAAVFPFFFWLPASYHTPPAAISAIFGGLLTKVGVYALLRVFTLLFTPETGFPHALLLWGAGLTMLTGVLGALAQHNLRRIFSFQIICAVGYMIMGLGLLTQRGLAGAVFYVLEDILVITNLFLLAGLMERATGATELSGMGGLYRHRPLLAALFVIPAFSLAGFPPLSGFWGKLILAQAGFAIGQYLIVAVALTGGLLTLISMARVWTRVFWRPFPREAPLPAHRPPAVLLMPVVVLAALTLGIGLYARPLYTLADRAATELLHPERYVEAVLGRSADATSP